MITDEIVELLAEKAQRRRVHEVRIGLGYTAVLLDDGRCAVAYTARDEAGKNCSALQRAGTIAGRSAAEVAGWVNAWDAITAAVGLATLNALIEPPSDAIEADVRELIRVRVDDVVGMVGYFGPLVNFLRQRAARLHIFERHPSPERDELPAWAASLLLPECDVVIFTSSALVTRELDGLLERALKAREVVLLGPSTPLLPPVFSQRRVTLLSGVRVLDSAALLRVVSEGGGTPQFGSAVRKVALRVDR